VDFRPIAEFKQQKKFYFEAKAVPGMKSLDFLLEKSNAIKG
jgi:hypothetical protein